jgi:hypothetical protein
VLLLCGCSGDGGDERAEPTSTTASTTTSAVDSPIPSATGGGVPIGGRAEEVFVDLDGYRYVDAPAAVLERFSAGFAAQPATADIVDSVAAKTVVPDDGPADAGAVVVSVALDEAVGPLAAGFREGVLASISSDEVEVEELDLAGRPASYVETEGQRTIYFQDGTTVLFFLGSGERPALEALATALVGAL